MSSVEKKERRRRQKNSWKSKKGKLKKRKKKFGKKKRKRIEKKNEKPKVHDVVFEIPKYIYQNFIEQCFSALKIKYSIHAKRSPQLTWLHFFGNKP